MFDNLYNKYKSMVFKLKSRHFNIAPLNTDILHGAIGVVTEAGELLDSLKKTIFYNRPVDEVNLKEEIGDCLFYLELVCQALGTTIPVELERNYGKLNVRYKDGFSTEKAINRNLEAEKEALTNGLQTNTN